jgi:LysR family transcriptional regulator, nitrogen assimilation regulatory protein
MELRELRYFRAVAECGSFSKAAAKLSIAQPSLSRQIQALEHELGAPLLLRTPRGAMPTEAGTLLLNYVTRLEDDVDGIKRTIASFATRVTGSLRIAVQVPVSFLILPQLVQAYRSRYPEVELQLVEALNADVIDMLLTGSIDAAIVDTPRTPIADLSVSPLWVEEFSLFGWSDAPALAGDRQTTSLTEIASLPFLAAGSRHAVRYLVDAAFERQSLRFKPVIEVNGPLMLFELVRAGLGYAVMPPSVFRPYMAFGDLRSVKIEPAIRRTISISTRLSAMHDRAISAFHDLTLDMLPDLVRTANIGPLAFYPPLVGHG